MIAMKKKRNLKTMWGVIVLQSFLLESCFSLGEGLGQEVD